MKKLEFEERINLNFFMQYFTRFKYIKNKNIIVIEVKQSKISILEFIIKINKYRNNINLHHFNRMS